jgi:5-methyltetrahydrofolate--homocysteine methyltransferase
MTALRNTASPGHIGTIREAVAPLAARSVQREFFYKEAA